MNINFRLQMVSKDQFNTIINVWLKIVFVNFILIPLIW